MNHAEVRGKGEGEVWENKKQSRVGVSKFESLVPPTSTKGKLTRGDKDNDDYLERETQKKP